MVNFELRRISQFVAIAEAGIFRQAEQQIFIAQPALSVAIRKLEKSLDGSLFDRSAAQFDSCGASAPECTAGGPG